MNNIIKEPYLTLWQWLILFNNYYNNSAKDINNNSCNNSSDEYAIDALHKWHNDCKAKAIFNWKTTQVSELLNYVAKLSSSRIMLGFKMRLLKKS